MKTIISLSFSILILLCSCNQPGPDEKAEFSIDQQEAIKNKLETIAKDFLKSWEPPFNPEAAVALFTQSDDFHLVIDGINIDTYSKWANGVPNFMSDDDYFFKSYTHEIEYIETVVLSAKSGVVTMVYIWDSISKEGIHERTPGAVTLTCREEENDWKIVHYHGSHGDPEIVKK
ncbi:MAG: hypothetical protein K9H13_12930 [Bacteroidales bacterium]|nr:hypothetical protein [Bacteroidales bacterium]MCF8345533.1 hypothetical protein [Bacteroidales bacterium]MCF8350161.1 hypothetical protein [Bacteroidales bacterium]